MNYYILNDKKFFLLLLKTKDAILESFQIEISILDNEQSSQKAFVQSEKKENVKRTTNQTAPGQRSRKTNT